MYLTGLLTKMRAAAQQADKFDKQWNELNDAFKRKHAEEDRRRRERGDWRKSDLSKAQEKDDNLELKDAFGAQAWWRTQATYYADLIQAEKAAYDVLHEGEL
jgi:hypothetical protein